MIRYFVIRSFDSALFWANTPRHMEIPMPLHTLDQKLKPFFCKDPALPGLQVLYLAYEKQDNEDLTPDQFATYLTENRPSKEEGVGIVISYGRLDGRGEYLSEILVDMLTKMHKQGTNMSWLEHVKIMTSQEEVFHYLRGMIRMGLVDYHWFMDQILCGSFDWTCQAEDHRNSMQTCGHCNLFPSTECSHCYTPRRYSREVYEFAEHCGYRPQQG